ncbi:MAG: hypothetical protein JJE53_00625 [Candidatus Pacebacteria bacterium]|nr:hypothetical protein [Candidatus Paceibacterota bacterium]
MGFIFSSQKKERVVAIFDIGSGSVGGALVKIPANNQGIPIIIKSVPNNEIKFSKDLNFNSLLKNMTSALYLTAHSLYLKKSGAPDEIFCVMSSPWYLSETRIIKMTRDKPFLFNKRLADDLINKEITSFYEIYKNKYGNSEGSPEILDKNIMNVSLNGYKIIDPLGKRGKSLEISMFISLSPKLCLDSIRNTLSRVHHHIDVNFSSFTVATYLAVRDKYINQDSYLLLDISGEITDVGIVSDGVLKAVLSFPFGKRTFYNQICSKLEIELRDAKELFKLYRSNSLSIDYRKKVEPVFKSIEKSWNESFYQCIASLPKTLMLPNTIFLTADNDIKNWFADVLRNEVYIQPLKTNHKCTVISIDGPEFLNMCGVKDGVCDPFLMIEAISIMRKTVK